MNILLHLQHLPNCTNWLVVSFKKLYVRQTNTHLLDYGQAVSNFYKYTHEVQCVHFALIILVHEIFQDKFCLESSTDTYQKLQLYFLNNSQDFFYYLLISTINHHSMFPPLPLCCQYGKHVAPLKSPVFHPQLFDTNCVFPYCQCKLTYALRMVSVGAEECVAQPLRVIGVQFSALNFLTVFECPSLDEKFPVCTVSVNFVWKQNIQTGLLICDSVPAAANAHCLQL